MIKYYGKYISVVSKRQRLPNGFQVDLEIVCHPGAVLIIPFISKEKVIFIKQYRPVIKKYLYELPAGTLNKKELRIACAKRELREETGYTAKTIVRLGKIYPVPGYSTEEITIYKAEGLIPENGHKDPDEIIKTHIFLKKDVKKLLQERKIMDAKTICALSFCRWL